MPDYLEDPSVLTKEKLKSELLAHSVELPSGNPTKDVYVQLYLKNLTAQNKKLVSDTTWDAFSSDEELPPPVVSNRSRSSGRKATRKTDKVQPDELDVTMLTDVALRDELLKQGVDVGPIVASTRNVYEKKLQKLLDNGPTQLPPPPQPLLVLPEIQVNHNGHFESDLYSDKEDEVTAEPEPVAEPEPGPVLERPVRSRGKTPVTNRTRSSQHQTIVAQDLWPVLRDPVHLESNRTVRHKHEDKPPTEPRSASSRRVESKSQSEEHSRHPAANPSSPLVQLTLSPISKISTIQSQGSPWTVSHQIGCKAGGVSAAGEECGPTDIQLHKKRQQRITSFLSSYSPVRTHGYTSTLSEDLSVEKITASDQNPKVEEKEVLKELFPNDFNSPSGISATCRRPIRGAAGRPLKPSDLWNNENGLLSPKITKTSSSVSSYTESRTVNRVTSMPPSATPSSTPSSTRLLSAAPPAGQTKGVRRGMSLWIKLFLLAIVAAFLFLVYQAMETNSINPFVAPDKEVASGSTA
ncbi:thymopoietin a isoform X2 [Scophthalmus maximus]|uniref:Thymopoietin a n=1 Tax=Scophthalmus maximus TaxID=52904 RepID=A0A8D3BXT0_SCOMX|nr:thymopoietin a isoform X2 [Scophthalmus maximus]